MNYQVKFLLKGREIKVRVKSDNTYNAKVQGFLKIRDKLVYSDFESITTKIKAIKRRIKN